MAVLPQSVSMLEFVCYCVSLSLHLSVAWARKYGLRIYLDLHALPGSQNSWVCALFESIICNTDIVSVSESLGEK
jgi:hypothetical protein